jgi:hypothetical protein
MATAMEVLKPSTTKLMELQKVLIKMESTIPLLSSGLIISSQLVIKHTESLKKAMISL